MKKKKGGKLKWIIIVLIVIGIIGAAAGGSEDDKVKDATEEVKNNDGKKEDKGDYKEDSEPEEKTEFYLGETAEQKNVQITLANITESSGSEFAKPDEGNIFLICEFEIANNSEKDINISSVMNFEAYCDDYSLNQDLIGLQAPEAEGKNQLDGSVAAGKKMNGIIAYQVPADYKTMEINVAPDFWSSNDMKFIYTK
ncbi:DUF4352 domain-containing protein [Lachnospiraceae bacterium JLR.KK009]|nr:hypothetical protein C810_05150 [Lachnospiraceae bacterium A2]